MVGSSSMAHSDSSFQSQHQNCQGIMSSRNAGPTRRAEHPCLCTLRPLCKVVTRASCQLTDFRRILEREKYWTKWACIALMKNAAPDAFPPHWVVDEDAEHVQMPSTCSIAASVGSVAQPASCADVIQDAHQFALSYVRDFRALHQFSHDHDCTTTCIKYVAKQCRDSAEEALRKARSLRADSSSFTS